MSYYNQGSRSSNSSFYSHTAGSSNGGDQGWYSAPAPTPAPAPSSFNGNNADYSNADAGVSDNKSFSYGDVGNISVMNPNERQTQQQQQQYSTNGTASNTEYYQPNNVSSNYDSFGNMFSGSMEKRSDSASISASNAPNSGSYVYDPTEFENEPPLMEELGINISHIKDKTQAVLFPFSAHAKNNPTLMDDEDLAGPMTFALLLGGTLLLNGKLHFGYIYGFGMFSCIGMALILNLMSPKDAISIWRVVSVLGYGLLPVNILAALNLVLNMKNRGTLGMVLAGLTIFWCTSASTRLFERSCDMRDQRYLIAYPIVLVYCCFVIITVF
mmetsp:Transcript_7137/g.9265  ORF Transcript_7137/g.9265 Transcript_7137/m.9265 type:complete len:327 (+) Transcript_7137:51-1031(+)